MALALPALHAEVGAYVNRVDGAIVFAPQYADDGSPAVQVTSQGAFPSWAFEQVDAVYAGLDGHVAVRVARALTVTAAGSRVRAHQRGTGELVPFVPADRGTVGLEVAPADLGSFDGTTLAVGLTGVARQRHTSAATDLVPAPDGYARLDASIDVPVTTGDQQILLGLAGTNLLNAHIRSYTSLLRAYADEPGRDVRFRASLIF